MVTETVKKSLCPTWDQTLIFGELDIFGDPKNLEISPPEIYIELFDYDTFVSFCVFFSKLMEKLILTNFKLKAISELVYNRMCNQSYKNIYVKRVFL